jgi:hypothetical protein
MSEKIISYPDFAQAEAGIRQQVGGTTPKLLICHVAFACFKGRFATFTILFSIHRCGVFFSCQNAIEDRAFGGVSTN